MLFFFAVELLFDDELRDAVLFFAPEALPDDFFFFAPELLFEPVLLPEEVERDPEEELLPAVVFFLLLDCDAIRSS